MKWIIYTLKNPRTQEVRYVGFTMRTAAARLTQHISHALHVRRRNHCQNWVVFLLSIGLHPILEVIESGAGEGWQDAERRWIVYYRQKGARLLNSTDGGEGVPGRAPWGTPEERSATAAKREAAKTADQRSRTTAKARAVMTPERRRAAAKEYWAKIPREDRSARLKQAWATMTPEALSARGKHAQASLTHEQRSVIAKKRSARVPAEQRRAVALKREAAKTPEQRSASARKREANRRSRVAAVAG